MKPRFVSTRISFSQIGTIRRSRGAWCTIEGLSEAYETWLSVVRDPNFRRGFRNKFIWRRPFDCA